MESGKLEVTFRDLYYLSTAKEKSWQKAHRIKDTKIETGDTRNIVTKEDYDPPNQIGTIEFPINNTQITTLV